MWLKEPQAVLLLSCLSLYLALQFVWSLLNLCRELWSFLGVVKIHPHFVSAQDIILPTTKTMRPPTSSMAQL